MPGLMEDLMFLFLFPCIVTLVNFLVTSHLLSTGMESAKLSKSDCWLASIKTTNKNRYVVHFCREKMLLHWSMDQYNNV